MVAGQDGAEPGGQVPSEVREGTEPAAGARRRSRWPWFVAAGLLLIAAGAFAGGAVVGWRVHDRAVAAGEQPTPVVVTVTAEPAGPSEVAMPDVRGLSEQTARQVIADAGVPASAIKVSTRQWAGDEGLVVEQTPVFGTENPTAVDLVLSERAVVPEAVGRPADDVADQVSQLGAQVTLSEVHKAGATPGTVLAVEPAAGEPLPGVIALTVAGAPSSVFLSAVEPLEGRCSAGEVRLNGPTYTNGMTCSVRDTGEFVWLLSRGVDSVKGAVGIPDTEDPAMSAKVEVIVDGKTVVTGAAAYGQAPVALDLNTAGALRLVVRVTNTSATASSAVLGFADVQLVGEPGAIREIGRRR